MILAFLSPFLFKIIKTHSFKYRELFNYQIFSEHSEETNCFSQIITYHCHNGLINPLFHEIYLTSFFGI